MADSHDGPEVFVMRLHRCPDGNYVNLDLATGFNIQDFSTQNLSPIGFVVTAWPSRAILHTAETHELAQAWLDKFLIVLRPSSTDGGTPYVLTGDD